MSEIVDIIGRQILDSRGNPTIQVDVVLETGHKGRASVPSGASTGSHEAHELRDGDKSFYNGKSVLRSIEGINGEIYDALRGIEAQQQRQIDTILQQLDGTENKSRLGAGALLGVSLSVAKAAAASCDMPLYKYIGGVNSKTLPVPMMNIVNGGKHADSPIDIQEFMIVPIKFPCFSDALRCGVEIFHALKTIFTKRGLGTNVGDEGGMVPVISSAKQVLEYLTEAIAAAGYRPGHHVFLALDCAATEYFEGGRYILRGENKNLSAQENALYLKDLCDAFPIISIEDGMAEDDWQGWEILTQTLSHRVQLVGDDVFTTNMERFTMGRERNIANAILVKPNQIGTLSEMLDVVDMAHRSGYKAILSHRSGETEDTTIADLAVATDCGQIKTGSVCRSDRVAKYNRLLQIEECLADVAYYPKDSAFVRLS